LAAKAPASAAADKDALVLEMRLSSIDAPNTPSDTDETNTNMIATLPRSPGARLVAKRVFANFIDPILQSAKYVETPYLALQASS
jgi:hypothetical protein